VDQSEIEWINALRAEEIRAVLSRVNSVEGNLLEIGGGSGYQASLLARRGMNVVSIDLSTSSYRNARQFAVIEYDGKHIPFPDEYFDVVFSSNTLEHIRDLRAFEVEIMRVLRRGGIAVHVLPSHHWRFWSWCTHYPALLFLASRRLRRRSQGGAAHPGATGLQLAMKALVPPRHGERGNSLTEYGYFHPKWWNAHFVQSGWSVMQSFQLGLFYTGYMLLKQRLSFNARRRLARYLGSASFCFVLERA
jgi:SAM-dependent methyltransferase